LKVEKTNIDDEEEVMWTKDDGGGAPVMNALKVNCW